MIRPKHCGSLLTAHHPGQSASLTTTLFCDARSCVLNCSTIYNRYSGQRVDAVGLMKFVSHVADSGFAYTACMSLLQPALPGSLPCIRGCWPSKHHIPIMQLWHPKSFASCHMKRLGSTPQPRQPLSSSNPFLALLNDFYTYKAHVHRMPDCSEYE